MLYKIGRVVEVPHSFNSMQHLNPQLMMPQATSMSALWSFERILQCFCGEPVKGFKEAGSDCGQIYEVDIEQVVRILLYFMDQCHQLPNRDMFITHTLQRRSLHYLKHICSNK